MNKLVKLSIVGFVGLSLAACSKVPAGYRGVIVNMYGSDKGVSDESVGVGRYYMGYARELYLFPTFLQNVTWNGEETISMQTSDGLTISSDVGITYSIQPDNVVKVFQQYRTGITEITNTFLRNMVRDAMNQVASTMTVEQLYGTDKPLLLQKVNDIVKQQAAKSGIDVDKIYLVGTLNLPQSVTDSINAKIQATQNAQKVENEVATSQAEAQKTIVTANAEAQRVLINAQAQAKANQILAQSITTELVNYQAVQKWNGVLPSVTGGATPMINLSK